MLIMKTHPNQKPTDMKQASMPCGEFDWSDPRCPQCGEGKIIIRSVRVRPVRELTKRTLAQAIAAGLLVEDGKYLLQDKIYCVVCNTATTFTDCLSTFVPRKSSWIM